MSAQHSQPFNPVQHAAADEVVTPSLSGTVDQSNQPLPIERRGSFQQKRHGSWRGWWWVLLTLLVVVGIVAGGLAYLQQSYTNRILNNVRVHGVNV